MAFTDEKIRILDFRVRGSSQSNEKSTVLLEGEHEDMIRKI